MEEKIMEVCCQCFYTGVESGPIEGDVWCPRCEEWISRSLFLPKNEVLKKRKEAKEKKRYYVERSISGVEGIAVCKEEPNGSHKIIQAGFQTEEEAQEYADELNRDSFY